MPEPEPLTDRDRAILEFERLRWRYQGAKEGEALSRFGLSSTRYYQVLDRLLDHPGAEEYDAETVRRLRRIRDARRATRVRS